MSGHSKWATIKHKKGALDAKRGKTFTKIIKEISVAAKMGGGDPEANPRLRNALLKARSANMPKDNIDRAIKKGTGELEGVTYSEITYEGYAPGGVALLISVLTDNKNRTAAEIRNVLSKGGGNLGATGSVSHMFRRRAIIGLEADRYSEDDVMAVVLDAGAEDVTNDGELIEVTAPPEAFEAVLKALEAAGMRHSMAEISMLADTYLSLGQDETRKVVRLIEALEDNDDVQSVASNLDIPKGFAMDE